eukprot:TRINITY_DN6601_c0_g1_i1.p1 TRINITY_DN6601_c0_g1~~TRINITY_DN6601_c0_g1_i1.p1  ORF type:complete len:126 (-),score=22.16 TRINITY_DN6601_c0_g1_i1:260-637(-)
MFRGNEELSHRTNANSYLDPSRPSCLCLIIPAAGHQNNLSARLNIIVNKEFIRRIFVEWVTCYIQRRVASSSWMRKVDHNMIYETKEVHFEKKDSEMAISPIGEPICYIDGEQLDERWSINAWLD